MDLGASKCHGHADFGSADDSMYEQDGKSAAKTADHTGLCSCRRDAALRLWFMGHFDDHHFCDGTDATPADGVLAADRLVDSVAAHSCFWNPDVYSALCSFFYGADLSLLRSKIVLQPGTTVGLLFVLPCASAAFVDDSYSFKVKYSRLPLVKSYLLTYTLLL